MVSAGRTPVIAYDREERILAKGMYVSRCAG